MNRLAIIIGSADVEDEDFLPGVEIDIANYYNYLKSPAGGAWRNNEIVVLNKPSLQLVKQYLLRRVDYTFTVFCGHGNHNVLSNTTFISLNDNDFIPVNELLSSSSKQTLILDACRELDYTINEWMVKSARLRNPYLPPTQAYALSCRNAFNQALLNADYGHVIYYSCSPNEAAGETRQGGVFTSKLINYCEAWASECRKGEQASTYLTVPILHSSIAQDLPKVRRLQNPHLTSTNMYTAFPIAVA